MYKYTKARINTLKAHINTPKLVKDKIKQKLVQVRWIYSCGGQETHTGHALEREFLIQGIASLMVGIEHSSCQHPLTGGTWWSKAFVMALVVPLLALCTSLRLQVFPSCSLCFEFISRLEKMINRRSHGPLHVLLVFLDSRRF